MLITTELFRTPVPSENNEILADLVEKFHISGDEDDCEYSAIDAITNDISSIAISVNDGVDGGM